MGELEVIPSSRSVYMPWGGIPECPPSGICLQVSGQCQVSPAHRIPFCILFYCNTICLSFQAVNLPDCSGYGPQAIKNYFEMDLCPDSKLPTSHPPIHPMVTISFFSQKGPVLKLRLGKMLWFQVLSILFLTKQVMIHQFKNSQKYIVAVT